MKNMLSELEEDSKPRGFGMPRPGERKPRPGAEGEARRKSMRMAFGVKRMNEPRGIAEEEGEKLNEFGKLQGQRNALRKLSGTGGKFGAGTGGTY